MTVINTNTKALLTQNALATNQRELADAMAALSTGKRINVAGDDAAGLAISTRMTSYARGLDQAVRNAGDAIALLQTIEGATIEFTNMMQRMRELAIQAASDTNANAERSYLNLEFQQLNQEMNRIAANTQWNGFNVLDGTARDNGAWRFQVGADAEQIIVHSAIDLRNLIPSASQAQQLAFKIDEQLAAGEVASITINGQTFTVTGSPATTQAGSFAVQNDLQTGNTASLTIAGQTFTLSTGAFGNVGTAQIAAATLDPGGNFGEGTAMSVTVNGQTFVLAGPEHTATTARQAAVAIASAINADTAKNQQVRMTFAAPTGVTVASVLNASAAITVGVNGVTYTVEGAQLSGTMTMSAAAVALAAQINTTPQAQVARVRVTDATVTTGEHMSISIGGNNYLLLSSLNTNGSDAGSALSLLAAQINGSDAAQVMTVSAGANALANLGYFSAALNGTSYTYRNETGGTVNASVVAAGIADLINGDDAAQIERVSMATLTVNTNMDFTATVNGTAYTVEAVNHTANTQASAIALLANKINNGQDAVDAYASGAVLTLRANVAGTAFSTGSLSIGAQATRSFILSTANNTAQTAVSAVASGALVVLTALTAGEAFSATGNRAGTATTATITTANNVAQSLVSATVSADGAGATLILTATEAGTGFTYGNNITVRDAAASATAITSAVRANHAGQTAVSATVSVATLIITSRTAGVAFSATNAQIDVYEVKSLSIGAATDDHWSATINGTSYGVLSAMGSWSTAGTSAQYAAKLAEILNSGTVAQVTAFGVSSKAAATSQATVLVNGVSITTTGTATTSADVAASIAALINANTTLSALVSATVSSYTPSGGTAGTQVILTARTAGFAGAFSATAVQMATGNSYAALTAGGMSTLVVGNITLAGASATVSTASAGNAGGVHTAVILTGTTQGDTFSVAGYKNLAQNAVIVSAVRDYAGVSAVVSTYVGNGIIQSAVSASVSGATVVLTALTPGVGFSATSFVLGTESFSTLTTVANDEGSVAASAIAAGLASMATASLSAISITASGQAVIATAVTSAVAFSAGVLSDGTSAFAYQSLTEVSAGGTTAASVRLMFASAINTQMDTVQASGVVSSLVITAATAGAGFSASDLNFNNTVIGYATLMENAGEGYTISTYAGAQATLEKLDAEMLFINGERAKIGSVVNRLEYAIDNLRNVSMNTKASRSQILDADYAEQSTELARTQIIQQAATSVLAQANSTQESVLKLLQ